MRKYLLILFLCLSLVSFSQSKYYIAPTGSDAAAGTIGDPWLTINHAADNAVAGDTVYIRGGTYMMTAGMYINATTGTDGASGTYANPICYFNYPGEAPIFDFFNKAPTGNYNSGLLLQATEHIKLKGFTIRNIYQTREFVECVGIRLYASANITLENITIHDVSGQGFCNYGGAGPGEQLGWETDTTRWINCDAYNLCDSLALPGHASGVSLGGFADGFKTDNYPGAYMEYTGCRAWNCSDDGFDGSGSPIYVYNNCWAFDCGYLTGGGEGIKGGFNRFNRTDTLMITVKNCISVNNEIAYHNNNASDGSYYFQRINYFNNIAYNNTCGFALSLNGTGGTLQDMIFRNNISYNNSIFDWASSYVTYIESNNTWDGNASYPGYTDLGIVSPADFASLDTTQLDGARVGGKLPTITFGRLSGASDLLGAGTNVGMSATPDIGIDWTYYDLTYGAGEASPPSGDVTATIYSNNVIPKSVQAITGGNITSDGGATITERGIVWGTSANPTGNKIVASGTTGSYSVTITGLSSNTTYHARSYAINSVGTAYGADVSFTTEVQSIGLNGATIGLTNGSIGIIK